MKIILLFSLTISFNLLFGQTYTEIASLNGMSFPFGNSQFEGGGGISFADFNQDGRDDLTFCTQLGDDIRYFMNTGGSFTEIFPSIPANLGETKQVLWVDYDNDGDKDLFATSFLNINRLYRNNGSMNFTDVTAASGLPTSAVYMNYGTYGASFGDYDNDGWLDLYVSNYGEGPASSLYPNQLYKNVNGVFTDVTASTNTGGGNKQSFCSIFVDYDNNNTPDLYIANDRVEFSNDLFQNNGGSFTNVNNVSGAGISIWAMNTGAGDMDGDGDLDLYVTNVGNNGNQSSLLVNNGGTFTEEASVRGVPFGPRVGWGGNFFDFDNDIDLDLYVCSLTAGMPNAFYVNDGTGNFHEPLISSGGLGGIDVVTSFVNAIGDINNDGNLDIAVSGNASSDMMLWENQSSNGNTWLKVHLVGTASNRDGISSWIEVYVGGQKLVRYTHSSMAYLAQNSYYHHFGLDKSLTVDSMIVRWPSGIVDMVENIAVNQTYSILEGSFSVVALPVDLLSFDARPIDSKYIDLNWKVENEVNFSGYEIERSIDGRDFTKIGWLKGRDAVSQTQYYFKDSEAKRGISYFYRLKLIDLDGSFEYSKVATARLELQDGFEIGSIHPNPVENTDVTLSINTNLQENIFVQIYNQTGMLVLDQKFSIDTGTNDLQIATTGMASGLYLVKVNNGRKEEIRKIIVH